MLHTGEWEEHCWCASFTGRDLPRYTLRASSFQMPPLRLLLAAALIVGGACAVRANVANVRRAPHPTPVHVLCPVFNRTSYLLGFIRNLAATVLYHHRSTTSEHHSSAGAAPVAAAAVATVAISRGRSQFGRGRGDAQFVLHVLDYGSPGLVPPSSLTTPSEEEAWLKDRLRRLLAEDNEQHGAAAVVDVAGNIAPKAAEAAATAAATVAATAPASVAESATIPLPASPAVIAPAPAAADAPSLKTLPAVHAAATNKLTQLTATAGDHQHGLWQRAIATVITHQLTIESIRGVPFSKGGGLKYLFEKSEALLHRHTADDNTEAHQLVAIIDVDMRVPANFFDLARRHVIPGEQSAVFYFDNLHRNGSVGRRKDIGYNPCVFARADAAAAGGMATSAFDRKTTWGDEDAAFHRRIAHFAPMQKVFAPGFSHIWHPRSRDNPWYKSLHETPGERRGRRAERIEARDVEDRANAGLVQKKKSAKQAMKREAAEQGGRTGGEDAATAQHRQEL